MLHIDEVRLDEVEGFTISDPNRKVTLTGVYQIVAHRESRDRGHYLVVRPNRKAAQFGFAQVQQ